jgi:hypothetical protein
MVQLTLTNVDRAQKNKRNLDTMTLLDSDDERGDKEDRYEHDDVYMHVYIICNVICRRVAGLTT